MPRCLSSHVLVSVQAICAGGGRTDRVARGEGPVPRFEDELRYAAQTIGRSGEMIHLLDAEETSPQQLCPRLGTRRAHSRRQPARESGVCLCRGCRCVHRSFLFYLETRENTIGMTLHNCARRLLPRHPCAAVPHGVPRAGYTVHGRRARCDKISLELCIFYTTEFPHDHVL